MVGRSGAVARMMGASLVVVTLVLSSAGCLVEEEGPAAPKVPDDRKGARLVVDGQVATPLNWTLEQVFDRGMEDFTATFVNSVGTTKTSNFTGVRVRAVLDEAGLNATAEILEVEAADGYRATIFLSDVTNTTHLVLKEEGQWQNLSDQGAMRLVDTRMGSVYWVKQVVALHLKQSTTLVLSGDMYYTTRSVTAGNLYSHATMNITWKEGTKIRTGRGLMISDVADQFNISAAMFELYVPGKDRLVHAASWTLDFLAIDSKGRFVYIVDQAPLATGLSELHALNGIHIYGNVASEMNITTTDLDALPQEQVSYAWGNGTGPTLASIVELASPMTNANYVMVGPGNGTAIEIPIGNLSDYNVIETQDELSLHLWPSLLLFLVAKGIPEFGPWQIRWIDVR